MTGSNRRPPACKAGALPAELILQYSSEATSYSHRGKPPTTIGAKELNFRVRYGNGCDLFAIITSLAHGCAGVYVTTGRGAFSRRSLIGFQYTALSFVNFPRSFSHVLDYAPSITQSFPRLACVLKPLKRIFILSKLDKQFIELSNKMWLRSRPISIRQLHTSPHFHLKHIYLIVFQGSYLLA